jgi:glycerol-3-phosphate acyltransferase PlsY
MLSILTILFGYLFGSIPTAYLAARWTKHMDLRRYGSGTVSGSMVYEHVSKLLVVPVGLFDIFKGALPTWLALQLGLGEAVAIIAGLAAVAGHNWPIYLRFTGGRGLSPFMGLLLVFFPSSVVWMLLFLGIGFALGDSAPWAIVSMFTMPLLVYGFNGPVATIWALAGMLLLTFAKRLEANRRPLPPLGAERRKVIFRRLFLDRDIANHQDWIRREPEQ